MNLCKIPREMNKGADGSNVGNSENAQMIVTSSSDMRDFSCEDAELSLTDLDSHLGERDSDGPSGNYQLGCVKIKPLHLCQ